MTINSQEKSLKQWHKVLLRLTLPIAWVLLLMCTVGTILFLGLPCGVAAFVSWVITGKTYSEYTIVPAIFPLAIGFIYDDWLKDNDILK